MAAGILSVNSNQLRSLRRILLRWYDQNRRELPWRLDKDPYRVWVSEIMLQQTRVAAVLDHYARFMRRFPSVESLAAARESSVLTAWSGLGYYNRARRMHQAAKIVVRERQGNFPRTSQEWSQLPGIGRYTAAAMASIAFDEAVAVVDGNVERVLQRLIGWKRPGRGAPRKRRLCAGWDSKETAWRQAQALLHRSRPGDFNQAMMELGATICTPRAPQCPVCPLNSSCKTRGADVRRPGPPRKSLQLNYALARSGGSILLVQRPADASLMAGMWELPMLSADQVNSGAPLMQLRHSITNTDYRIAVYAILPDHLQGSVPDAKWFTSRQYERLPLTGLTRKILRHQVLASTRPAAVSK